MKTREYVIVDGTGLLGELPAKPSEKWSSDTNQVDFNGLGGNKDKTMQELQMTLRMAAKKGTLGSSDTDQDLRYYNLSVEGEPKTLVSGRAVKESGFHIAIVTNQIKVLLRVWRTARATLSAEKGLLEKAAAGNNDVKI